MGTSVRTLLDVLPLAAMVRPVDSPRLVYANPAMCRLLGYGTPDEVIQGDPFSHIADEKHKAQAIELRRALLAGGFVGFHPGRWRRRDGGTVPVEVTAAVIDFDGVRSVLIVGRDLVERTDLSQRLAIAERMASVGTLAAGVVHEINNPLTYLLLRLEHAWAAAQALAREVDADRLRVVLDDLEHAREGAARIRDIGHSLKAMSTIDTDDRVLLDVRSVIESASTMVKHQIEQSARLVVRFGSVPLVRASPGRLEQVFVNLLVNAAQAIGVGHADANEIGVTTSESESGGVVVLVRDTGPGIASDALPLVFNPFFTTKGQGGGTGLGLSICHGIVSALGGTITASNTESRGAVFRVELPGVHGEVASKPPSTASSNVPQERKRVLIVDDEVKVALVCKMTLEPSFDVVVTRSASEALDLLAKDERFDVILCDLMMHVRTGIELYAGVERSHPQLRERIVFMTGGATTDATRAFLDSAPNMRVDKPFTVEELLAVVSSGAGR